MDLNEEVKNFITKHMKSYVPPRYLTQKQVCSYAGVGPATVTDWVRNKGLRIIIMEENSNPKYDIKDVDAFLEKYKTREIKS